MSKIVQVEVLKNDVRGNMTELTLLVLQDDGQLYVAVSPKIEIPRDAASLARVDLGPILTPQRGEEESRSMDPLIIALITTGGSMVGATLAQLAARRLANRREDALKFAEVKARLAELESSRPSAKELEADPDKRGDYLKQINAYSRWLVGMSPYLTPQQEEDVNVAKAQLAEDGTMPYDAEHSRRWRLAQTRLFYSRGRPWRDRLKSWQRRRLLAAKPS